MNLVIDIGNSSTKLAVYDGNSKIFTARKARISEKAIKHLLSKYNPDAVIVSSVRRIPEFLHGVIEARQVRFLILTAESELPFAVKYESPGTLGSDRLAAVAGAASAFPGCDIMVIDAGSAITYELLIGGEYHGGAISPGIEMRFRALNRFTGKLPLVKRSGIIIFPGKTTEMSINAGVISGVVFEINEYIRTFVTRHPGIKVILTGGDGAFIRDLISGDVLYLPDIVTDGLNYILNYNAK